MAAEPLQSHNDVTSIGLDAALAWFLGVATRDGSLRCNDGHPEWHAR